MDLFAAEIAIPIPWARSLKDKRQVAQRLIARIGRMEPVGVAEVDHQDNPRLLVLGIVAVGDGAQHTRQMIERCVGQIESEGLDATMIEIGPR